MKPERYLNLYHVADVILDTIYFGGVNTTYDALSLAKPVVVFPTQFQRGRYAAALFNEMEITDCIADSRERYVDIAVQLATNCDFNRSVSDRIRERRHQVFRQMEPVRQTEEFFVRAIEAARSGRTLSAQLSK